MIATVYGDIYKKYDGKYHTIDSILEQIRSCSRQKQVDEIRNQIDEKKAKHLKGFLPCICFSGKFESRFDDKLLEHSGFAIIDYDHLEDIEAKRSEMKQYDFVYAIFISPSGSVILK